MAYFLYNFVMALCTFFFPEQIATFIEAHLPVKGGWFSVVSYLLLYKTDAIILNHYSTLVDYSVILVIVLEMTQITNFTFKLSRLLKDRLNYEKGVLQIPALAILGFSAISLFHVLKYFMNAFGQKFDWESAFLILTLIASILSMTILSTMGRFYQGIISNGMLLSAYFAITTKLN